MRPALLAVLALAVAPAAVVAQDAPEPRLPRTAVGASVGPIVPLGAFGRAADAGIRAGLWIETAAGGGAAGRLEASFDHFMTDRAPPIGGRAGADVYSLTANVVATGRRKRYAQTRLGAYLVGGLGIYTTHTTAGGPFGGVATGKAETHARVGANGGGGLRLPIGALQLVAEARVHLLLSGSGFGSRDIGYLPVLLGLRF